ncbi:MAG: class I SAM-dependent methyltransferase [Gemmatimonadota bacterium]|nr:class I SAM-dependent methyltransferase [Gemmatimonadota bacterium]
MVQIPTRQLRFSDGDSAERDMLLAVKNTVDVSLESEELTGKVKDIASYYHLGIGRSTILRCLDLPAESRVLELGAGCGAITRYLGETFGSVDAVDASPIRVEIARERCRDLDNVSVLCRDLRNERFDSSYDVVVIIGVLEYAPVFIYPGEAPRDACSKFLQLARSALNENGKLVLAIENRIGLDYWAGAPENHTGKPYDGVHDYPNAGSPVTFTRTELQELLADAGFPHKAFYYCFPDYHYASTILSSTGAESEYCLHNWVGFSLDSPRNTKRQTFNKPLAAKTLGESGLLREFANSFLIVAGRHPVPDANWVARKFSMKRQRRFRIVTTLFAQPEPFVRKTPLHALSGASRDTESDRVRLRTEDAGWKPGNLLSFEIEQAALREDFPDYLSSLIDRYRGELESHYGTGERDAEGYPLLNTRSLDAVFANIIQDENGNLHFIDEEWQTESEIPIDFMLYRCIRFCLFSHGVSDAQAGKMIRTLFPSYSRSRHKKNRALADAFQREIFLDTIDPRVFKGNLLGRVVRNDVVRPCLEKVWRRTPRRLRTMIRRRLL